MVLKLGFGRTTGGVNVALLVGDDGSIGGSGEPAGETGSHAHMLMFGRTTDGDNVPVKVTSNGLLVAE